MRYVTQVEHQSEFYLICTIAENRQYPRKLCVLCVLCEDLNEQEDSHCEPLQRSYRTELFNDAISRMVKARIKTESELEQFHVLQAHVDSLVVEKAQSDVDFSDAPDEFRGRCEASCDSPHSACVTRQFSLRSRDQQKLVLLRRGL